jgi:amino acid adenylation domain-containing protein
MDLPASATGRAAAYWQARLDGFQAVDGFPADLAPAGEPAGIELESVELPDELVTRLHRISKGKPGALYVLLVAGLVGLLRRYARTEDVAVGLPGRCAAGPQLLVLRASAGGTLRQLLPLLADAVRDALTHQDHLLDPQPQVAISLAGLHDEPAPSARLHLRAEQHPAGIRLAVHYDADRYTADTARQVAGQLAILLTAAAAEPDRPLADFELWTAEDERLLAASNATDQPLEPATLVSWFGQQAAAAPDASALLIREEVVSFGELDRRSDALANLLCQQGIGRDELVAVLADRSVELLVALFGVLKAGAGYLPIDPGYPAARIDYLLTDSDAKLVLAPGRLAELAGERPVLDLAELPAVARPIENQPPEPGDLAYAIYTSGSTGQPKGVLVEHRSVVNRLAWMQRAYPIGPGDVLLQKTSICFDVSVWELFWWSGTGAALALLEPGAEKDPAAIIAAIERHAVTVAHFVPSMLTPFLAHVERYGEAARLASLRRVFTSGEALTPQQAGRFATLFPDTELVNLYGPTEATVDVSHHRVQAGDRRARVPIGRPIDNLRAYLLDPAGHRVPIGLPGELHLAGVGLARGYHRRPELTAERFPSGAGLGEDRLYRTGDLARWLPDGSLDYLGRIDRQLKIRGFRVEPGEIEECLRSHPAVQNAAVVDRTDGWQTTLRGFVIAEQPVTEADLKRYLRQRLPEHLVPARIAQLDRFPLTANGKLDRDELRRPGRRSGPSYLAPRDERERALAGIWAQVLGLPRVGVLDDFFALGGNSIHFVEVLAQARTVGLSFTFQQLFQHHTIAGLIEHAVSIEPDLPSELPDVPFGLLDPADRQLVPAGVTDGYPLSLLQAGLIFQTEITGALGQYHDVLSYLVAGRFDPAAFTEAVRALTERHPILRTSYRLTGYREFVQLVHSEVPPPLFVDDLRELTAGEQEAWHERWLAAEKRRHFDWAAGGLVTLHVQILAEDRYRYTISQHNSALDGWSISLLHTQLFALYEQFRDGLTPAGQPADHHLRTFLALERAAIDSAESRDFWQRVLRDSSATRVPRSRADTGTSDFRVIMHDVALPAGLTGRVIGLADQLSVPVKDVLLAAHVKVLGELAGESSVLTGYEHSGRPELPGAQAALGLFLNTLPLRIELAGGSWAELIGRVYQAELDLLPHRRYPMARMKQDLGTQRQLFETTFNYTHFYLLKRLKQLPEFALLDLRVDSETEFVFRTEFSRHFFDDDLRLCLHYHEHLFEAEHIARIGEYFVSVLEQMAAEPAAPHAGRQLLAEPDRAGAPGPAEQLRQPNVPVESAGSSSVGGPIGEAEITARIVAVWAEVLDLPAAEIEAGSDFFALGGNSLSALRVALETDGLVTLTDLMRHPTLAELVRLTARRRQGRPDVLQLLSSTAAGTRCVLVCVPYPSGHPINFAPLAAELEELTSDLAVYGLLAPGHDQGHPAEFTDVVGTAQLAADELSGNDLPVLIWGHCGGAAVAVELARQLESAGRDVRALFIGSKLLPPIAEMQDNERMTWQWSDQQIIRYMVDETGYTDLDELEPAHAAFIATTFRHDVGGGYAYFIEALHRGDWQLSTPLTFVVAADDRGLADYPDRYQRWSLVAPELRLRVIDSGGHYFVRTNPAATAGLVLAAWETSTLVDGIAR